MKELRQDWSGHVSFNAQQAAFVASIESKRVLTEKQRVLGQLRKQDRNPILDLKTPRYGKPDTWDYHPGKQPEHLKSKEKWNYETHDGTIMAKLQTQKNVFAEQKRWQDECELRVQEFDEFQKSQKLQNTSQKETKSVQLAETSRNSARVSARGTNRYTPRGGNSVNIGGSTIIENNTSRMNTERSDISALTDRSDFQDDSSNNNDTKLTTLAMRTLAHSNPQVNAEHRAIRAANYVSSLRKPLLPPTYRSVGDRDTFKPPGYVQKLSADGEELGVGYNNNRKSKKNNGNSTIRSTGRSVDSYVDTARLKNNLGQLVEALEATDKQLALQQLKVTLNSKTKSYEKPRKGSKSARDY